jgi:hypothetical protein
VRLGQHMATAQPQPTPTEPPFIPYPHRAGVLRALVPDSSQLHPPAPHFGEPTSLRRSPSSSPTGKSSPSLAAGEHRCATPVRGRTPSGRPRPFWPGLAGRADRAGRLPCPALLLQAECRPTGRESVSFSKNQKKV